MQVGSGQEDPSHIWFTAELEFVQYLANPEYLHYLGNNGYLDNPDFLRYVKHLKLNWSKQEYLQHLQYPSCIRFMEALEYQVFRDKIKTHEGLLALKIQQGNAWIGYRRTVEDYEDISHQARILFELQNPPPGEEVDQSLLGIFAPEVNPDTTPEAPEDVET